MAKPSPRERMIEDLNNREGALELGLRRAVMAHAKRLEDQPSGELPEHLRAYVDKVARHAYQVTDADVQALQGQHSTGEIYELTVVAAVGASLARRELALGLLRAGRAP